MKRTNRHEEIRFTPPMECLPVSSLPEGPGWVYELKLDGYRAQAIWDKRGVAGPCFNRHNQHLR